MLSSTRSYKRGAALCPNYEKTMTDTTNPYLSLHLGVILQIDFIMQHLNAKGHTWFYFDLHHSQWLYLDGEKRDSIHP